MGDNHAETTTFFLLKSIRQIVLPPNQAWSLPGCPEHALLMITEGSGYWQGDDTASAPPLSSGSVRFFAPEAADSIVAGRGASLSFFALFFDALQQDMRQQNNYAPDGLWHPPADSYHVQSLHVCLELARALLADHEHKHEAANPLDMLQNQIRFQQLLLTIWEAPAAQAVVESSHPIDQTLSYIHEHYAQSLSLADLANKAGLTPRYYTELFKKNVGKSPIEYLTGYRMDQAKKLLWDSKKRLREVAQLVGYEDEFYFSRRFKQQVGVSPTVFVKMSQRQIAPVTFQYTEYLMALGIKPVGAQEDQVSHMREQLRLQEASDIISLSKACPDLIKPLQPSFILTDYPKDCAAFSSIAPTCALSWTDDDVFGHLQQIADLFGQKDKALLWFKQHEQKVQKTKRYVDARIGKEETVSILNVRPAHTFAYGVRNIGHVLYKSLKLTPPPIIQDNIKRDPNFWAVPVQEHQLNAYAADWLFVHIFDDDLSRAHFQTLTQRKEWQSIPAVQKGQVVLLGPVWFAYDPLSLDAQLDEAIQLLEQQKTS